MNTNRPQHPSSKTAAISESRLQPLWASRRSGGRNRAGRSAAALLAAAALGACSIPPVRLETPEPVKIDVNVKVDIAHDKPASAEAPASPALSRRTRMTEIQNLKNSRAIGEDRNGYLAVRDMPPAWKGKENYVREIVNAENRDRKSIYADTASDEDKPVGEIEKVCAERIREKSYAGEWIQTPEGDWRQK